MLPEPMGPLPDRAIYRSTSFLAYLGALFVHSGDECIRFWQTDWRALSLGIVFPTLGLWFSYFVRGEVATMSDAQSILITTALPPVAVAVALYLWGVLKAPWQLHRRVVAAAAWRNGPDDADGTERLKDEVGLLAAQLRRFAAVRKVMGPSSEDLNERLIRGWNLPGSPDSAGNLKREMLAHDAETMATYDREFAQRVVDVRNRLWKRGVVDERLDQYPTNVYGVQVVGECLAEIGEKLPQNAASGADREPRRLAPAQHGLITRTIIALIPDQSDRGSRTVEVVAIGADREVRDYAEDYANALKSAGLRVTSTFSADYEDPFVRANMKGVRIWRDDDCDPPTASVIGSALRAASIEYQPAVPAPAKSRNSPPGFPAVEIIYPPSTGPYLTGRFVPPVVLLVGEA